MWHRLRTVGEVALEQVSASPVCGKYRTAPLDLWGGREETINGTLGKLKGIEWLAFDAMGIESDNTLAWLNLPSLQISQLLDADHTSLRFLTVQFAYKYNEPTLPPRLYPLLEP